MRWMFVWFWQQLQGCTVVMYESTGPLACLIFTQSHPVQHLYKIYHKQHHEFTSPFALAAVYSHPVEFILADLIPFTAGFLVFRPHISFVFMWIIVRVRNA